VKYLLLLVFFLVIHGSITGQKVVFNYEKTPLNSGFKMEGYWVWGGSMIKVGSTYHLFASRWKKDGPFPEGYRQNSEIVRATSSSPTGPFSFQEVVIGERDSLYWDSNMSHNPTIHKIGNEYVLFYIGSDFTTANSATKGLLRRVGYASSKKITGPWKRSDKPVIDSESNNPALLIEESKVKLVYRDSDLKVFIAEADNYKGPYILNNDNAWSACKLEDFYIFRAGNQYHIICEDNVGGVSGHVRWGVHLVSENGITGWQKYDPVVVYDHDILMEDNSVLKCVRRERPQLLIEKGKITCLINGVFDGNNSWCQPVILKEPIFLR
jgi:hypothetical protein